MSGRGTPLAPPPDPDASELERSLQASWSLDTLAVYADLLQQRGDPRGELIALDLSPAPEDKAWRTQRGALLVAWLGEELAARAGHLIQHGFIPALRDDPFHPPGLLDGPLGHLVRSCTLRGHEQTLARFASRPRPWLVQLTFFFMPWGFSERVGDTVRDALIAATPHLQEVQLLGARPAFEAFPHPSVRRVYVGQRYGRGPRHTVAVPPGVEVRDLASSSEQRGPSVTPEELELVLDAVQEQPDCGRLQEAYGALFTDGDSLPMLLARLRSAGLITLDGSTARLTSAGRAVRHREHHVPVRVRAAPRLDYRKWVLWADARQPEDTEMVALLSHHVRLLDTCLAVTPLERPVQDVLLRYRYFLDELLAADDSERLEFNAPGTLAHAVETLLELWELLDADRLWDGSAHQGLRNLAVMLGPPAAPRKPRFYLVWGM